MLKNWQLKITFWLCVRIFLVTAQNLFLDSTSPNIISLSLENHSKRLNKYVQVSSNHNMQRMSDAGIPPPKLRLLAKVEFIPNEGRSSTPVDHTWSDNRAPAQKNIVEVPHDHNVDMRSSLHRMKSRGAPRPPPCLPLHDGLPFLCMRLAHFL